MLRTQAGTCLPRAVAVTWQTK